MKGTELIELILHCLGLSVLFFCVVLAIGLVALYVLN